MKRFCSHCYRQFTDEDFVRDESRGMEADRRASGLEGVRFLYYRCHDCDWVDIFVDILPLEGETPEHFRERRDALEAAARQIDADGVEVVLTEPAGAS
jgi:hypothetical protein